jgi:hypothetical protein
MRMFLLEFDECFVRSSEINLFDLKGIQCLKKMDANETVILFLSECFIATVQYQNFIFILWSKK